MKTDSKINIYKYIENNAPVSVKDLVNHFNISSQIIHRHLNDLVHNGEIYKIGTPPKVYYFPQQDIKFTNLEISENERKIINDNFLLFTPDGRMLKGVEGFTYWIESKNLNLNSEVKSYTNTIKKYEQFKDKNSLINGLFKIKNTFEEIYLDELYYLDFYSIEKYGKTKLGNLMFYGKQNGDREIIKDIMIIISSMIHQFIKTNNIDTIAYTPPSINRKVQLLDEIKKGLNLELKELKLIKIFKDKIVPQKSLSNKEDRIINARDTIFIEKKDTKSKKILVLDDAVGSGATLNEIAKKIKDAGICDYVVGIAIVGSFKGFDIIREV